MFFGWVFFFDFVRLATRAEGPHGAYVRRAKRNRIDRRARIVKRLRLRYAKLYADLIEGKKGKGNYAYAAYWQDWKDMSTASRSAASLQGVDNYKESAGLGWWNEPATKGIKPGSPQEKTLWHCKAFGLDCAVGGGSGSKDTCQYDAPLAELLRKLGDCPADACSAGYMPGAGKDTQVVCYHTRAKKCGCEAGCANSQALKQCKQAGLAPPSPPAATTPPFNPPTAATRAPGSKDTCQYDKPVAELLKGLDECAGPCAKYLGAADKDTAIVCRHPNIKLCGCEAGCSRRRDLVQCRQPSAPSPSPSPSPSPRPSSPPEPSPTTTTTMTTTTTTTTTTNLRATDAVSPPTTSGASAAITSSAALPQPMTTATATTTTTTMTTTVATATPASAVDDEAGSGAADQSQADAAGDAGDLLADDDSHVHPAHEDAGGGADGDTAGGVDDDEERLPSLGGAREEVEEAHRALKEAQRSLADLGAHGGPRDGKARAAALKAVEQAKARLDQLQGAYNQAAGRGSGLTTGAGEAAPDSGATAGQAGLAGQTKEGGGTSAAGSGSSSNSDSEGTTLVIIIVVVAVLLLATLAAVASVLFAKRRGEGAHGGGSGSGQRDHQHAYTNPTYEQAKASSKVCSLGA